MSQTTTYFYDDGSANRYIISATTLEYDPVKPEESSTGTYSGGEPKTVSITSAQFGSIRDLLDKAVANTEIHIEDRIKTSGAITMINGDTSSRVIIEPHCPEMEAIEKLLKELIAQ